MTPSPKLLTAAKRYGVPERVMLATDDPGACRAMPHDTIVVRASDHDVIAADLARANGNNTALYSSLERVIGERDALAARCEAYDVALTEACSRLKSLDDANAALRSPAVPAPAAVGEPAWHYLPRELRDLITAYGNTQHECGRGCNKEFEPYMAGVEAVSRARDALTSYLCHHHLRASPAACEGREMSAADAALLREMISGHNAAHHNFCMNAPACGCDDKEDAAQALINRLAPAVAKE